MSGQDYYEYVREHIYEPAGMADTDCPELDRDDPELATGYTLRDPARPPPHVGPMRGNAWALPQRGAPSGLGCSTVRDLHRFGRALLAPELLSPAMTELVLADKTLVAEDYSYCYGFEEHRFGDTRTLGHGGGYVGISADLGLYSELGYTVALLSNYDPAAAQRVGNHARRLIEASWEANIAD